MSHDLIDQVRRQVRLGQLPQEAYYKIRRGQGFEGYRNETNDLYFNNKSKVGFILKNNSHC